MDSEDGGGTQSQEALMSGHKYGEFADAGGVRAARYRPSSHVVRARLLTAGVSVIKK